VLRLTFSAAYCSIPALGLATSWLVCRRRPSLFIWPAMSICIAALPGAFSFQNEQIMVATLLWPALLMVLLGAPAAVMVWVATLSVIAAASHPVAAPLLGLVLVVALLSAIGRRQLRTASLGYALFFGMLLIARLATPLAEWERSTLGLPVIINSFRQAVWGGPLIAIGFTIVAALGCLFSPSRYARIYLITALIISGVTLVVWAFNPANWADCLDYRYWVPPLSMILMSATAIEELWLRTSTERLQEIRLYALPLIGTIFVLVLSIQSLQWRMMTQRLRRDLVESDRGCVSFTSIGWLRDTPFNHWAVIFYAVDLQGRQPSALLLPNPRACRQFAIDGDATLVALENWTYVKHPGQGWFDFEDAEWKTQWHQRFFEDNSKMRDQVDRRWATAQ
jgi:hypothetical protein